MSFKVEIETFEMGHLSWEPPVEVRAKLETYPDEVQKAFNEMFETCFRQLTFIMSGSTFAPTLASEALETTRAYMQMALEINISRLQG